MINIERVIQLRKKGYTLQMIADHEHVTRQAIYVTLKRKGIKLGRAEVKKSLTESMKKELKKPVA